MPFCRPSCESFHRRLLGRRPARDLAPAVSLVVLVAFFCLATPHFLSPATVTEVLRQGSVRGIVAVGLTFVLLCGEIDLAVGTLALWAACLCGWLFEHWAMPAGGPAGPWRTAAVILLPLLSCLALGLLTGALTVATRLPSFIISLAMMFIAHGSAQYLTRSANHDVPAVLKTLGNDGVRLTAQLTIPYMAVLAAVVFLLGHFVLRYTRFGRRIYATGGNREAARLNGIRTSRILLACMGISGVAAAIGGMLNAGQLTTASMDQNADLLLSAVACVVLGGTSLFGGEGGVGKTLVGVLTYTVLGLGLDQITWIDNFARPLLTGVVLLAALVLNGALARKR